VKAGAHNQTRTVINIKQGDNFIYILSATFFVQICLSVASQDTNAAGIKAAFKNN